MHINLLSNHDLKLYVLVTIHDDLEKIFNA